MKTQTLLLSALLGASTLLTSCDQKDQELPAPTPDPAAEFKLERYFSRSNGFSGTIYPPADCKGAVTQTATQLVLSTKAGMDAIKFEIEQNQLLPQRIGEYTFKSVDTPTGAAFVTYAYERPSSPSIPARAVNHSSSSAHFDGKLTITAYDAQRQLISGKYEVEIPDAIEAEDGPDPKEKYKIVIFGSFQNAKVKPE